MQTLTTGALSIGTVLGSALIDWLGAATTTYFFGAWLLILAIVTLVNRGVRGATISKPARNMARRPAATARPERVGVTG